MFGLHRDCVCVRFAAPTSSQYDVKQTDCLDLRVPSRKSTEEERSQEYPDSSVDNVNGSKA